MTLTAKIQITVAGLVGAAILSPVALAGGEPKNDWPFTRSVAERTPAQVQINSQQVGAGEPKNQLPFTRPVSGGSYAEAAPLTGVASVGEAKNELPFTQSVSDGISSGNGFRRGRGGYRRRGRSRHCGDRRRRRPPDLPRLTRPQDRRRCHEVKPPPGVHGRRRSRGAPQGPLVVSGGGSAGRGSDRPTMLHPK
jgi:hypothetical protein